MEIARLWGRDPAWVHGLPREERARMVAWYRVHLAPEPPKSDGPPVPRRPR